jgi:hypothetical protein
MSTDVLIYLFDQEPYERSLLPAYRTFVEKADTGPLVKLLNDAIPQLDLIPNGYSPPSWSKAVYEEDIAILTGKEYYSSQAKKPKEGETTTPEDMRLLVHDQVAPELLELLCIPRNLGVKPEQSMSRTALDNYLYSQSRWIEDYFTGSKHVTGPVPEIKLGEWSQFFTTEEVEAFDKELSRIERPTDERVLADGFDDLRTLVHTAATHPNLRLLYVYM